MCPVGTELHEYILLHWWKCEEGSRRREGYPFRDPKDSSRLHTVFPLTGQIHSTAVKFAVVPGPQVLRQLTSQDAAEEHCLLSNINILHVSFQLKERVTADKKTFQSFSRHECAQPTATCNVFKQSSGSTAKSGTCQD